MQFTLKIKTCKIFALITLICACSLLTGCISAPYEYGTGRMDIDLANSPAMQQQFYVGEPHAFLDKTDWIWPGSLLGKLILWDTSVDSHQISDETIAAMKQYMADNDLQNVQVLINCYKPGNQWKRLFKNKTVHPFWRYTLGILSVATYTALPGRFFGGDAYNPYTNTIYLYSDNPAIALHEAGHSKDFGKRELKGTNAAIYSLPLAALYYEAKASSDALSYLDDKKQKDELGDAYDILYPAYGTYVGGSFADFSSEPLAAQLVIVIPAHVIGRIKGAIARGPDDEQSSEEQTDSEVEK